MKSYTMKSFCALLKPRLKQFKNAQTVPTIAETARKGKLKFRIGNGQNIVDFTRVLQC